MQHSKTFVSRPRLLTAVAVTLAAVTTLALVAWAMTANAAKPGETGEPRAWPLRATLLGKNEVGENGKKKAGDSDGRGGAIVAGSNNKICVAIAVKGIGEPTAAHIHKGKSGRNGPIVFDAGDPQGGDPGAGSACGSVSEALFKDLRDHSRRYYVNVHNDAFPNGALRGQLRRK